MWIIGVDYHSSVQQIAFVNTDTGECSERRLSHSDGEAEKFYRELKAAGCSVRVGIEATGHAAGSSGCWRNWASSYGLEIRRRSRLSGCESRRRTARMPRCCCSCCWRIAFLGCGCPVRKIEICVTCCGIGIVLVEAAQAAVRCDPDWRRRYTPWRCDAKDGSPR